MYKYLIHLGLIFLCPQLHAEYQWKSVSIGGGGYVPAVEFHPTQKDLIYLRTDVGGAYQWQDNNKQWSALNDSTSREHSDDWGILSIALDQNNADNVYLLSGLYIQNWAPHGALLKSHDRGRTWQRIPLPFKVGGNESGRGAGERLAVNPSNPQHLIAGTQSEGLWQSYDQGLSWKKIESFPETGVMFVLFVYKNTKTNPVIYISTHNKSRPLWVSQDNGLSWQAVDFPETDFTFHRATLSENEIFLTANDGEGPSGINKGAVWKLNIHNHQWTRLSTPEGQGGFGGISIDRNNSARMILSTNNRWHPQDDVFLTEDQGKTWVSVLNTSNREYSKANYAKGHKPHWIHDIKIDPHNSKHAIFVTGYGVYSTHNLTASNKTLWHFENDGLEETVPLELISPPKGAHLLSVMGDLDGFRHDDLDKSPASGRFKPEKGSNTSIAFAFNQPDYLVRIFEKDYPINAAFSKNGGRTWTEFANEPEGATGGQVALSANGKTVYWTPLKQPLFYSHNNGKTWHKSFGIPDNLKPVTDTVDSKSLYAFDALNGVIYSSNNAAKTFTPIQTSLPKLYDWQLKDGNLRTVPGHKHHFFVTTGGDLYFSSNAGKTLEKIPSVQKSYLISFGASYTDSKYPSIYLFGQINNQDGFYRSDDKGKNWTKLNDQLHQFGNPRCMVGDLRIPGRFYIGTNGRGIIRGDAIKNTITVK